MEIDCFPQIMGIALSMMREFEEGRELYKERIRKEWEGSKALPRKKKKRVRRELRLAWAIANFDPLGSASLFKRMGDDLT